MSKLKLRIPDYDHIIKDPHYKGWVPMVSYNFDSAVQPGNPGQGAVLRDFKEVSLLKEMDLLTPLMTQAVASGHHLTQVVILQGGFPTGSPQAVLLFSDVLFTSYQSSGSGGGQVPIYSFSLSYGKMAHLSRAQYLALKGAAALYKLANWFQ